MEYPKIPHGPTACTYYPSTDPDKRRVLMGGFDGHLRFFDKDAVDDDGVAIDNFVWIGPFEVGRVTEAKVMRIASVLDAQSPALNWEIHAGDTAEEAKQSPALATGSWNGGRNNWKHVRVSRTEHIPQNSTTTQRSSPGRLKTLRRPWLSLDGPEKGQTDGIF